MPEPSKRRSLWGSPTSSEKADKKQSRRNIQSGIITLLLTAVIIAGGFGLPTMLNPFLDTYSNQLVSLDGSAVNMTGHLFEELVALYPWDIYEDTPARSLTSYELNTLEQSGFANLLLDIMELRGIQLEDDLGEYQNRILGEFRCLEPTDPSQLGCFVLVDSDIDLDGFPDVRAAVDFSGKIISLLFFSDTWPPLALSEPIIVATEEPSELLDGGEKTDELTSPEETDTPAAAGTVAGPNTNIAAATNGAGEPAGDAGGAGGTGGTGGGDGAGGTGGGDTGGANVTEPPATQVDFRPLQEEENIWLFSYVMSREALVVGQMDVFSAFRQLELSHEARFGYPFINLIAPDSGIIENLPPIELLDLSTDDLTTGTYLLRVFDFSDRTRLVLYINPSTQACEGFNLGITL